MRILYVGDCFEGSTALMRAQALMDLGHEVAVFSLSPYLVVRFRLLAKVQWRLLRGGWINRLNRDLRAEARRVRPAVVWVDKGVLLRADTLRAVKAETGAVLIHYNPDDPFGTYRRGWRIFFEAIPAYDALFVPRPQNVPEYQARGAAHVFEFDRSFHARLHYPRVLTDAERAAYAAPVGFVGNWAAARARSMASLVAAGVPLSIRGPGWVGAEHWDQLKPAYRGGGLFGEEYPKAISGLEIALHFLRHENRDAQDSRTFEIPACGAFMLAERSDKHLEFFEDGKEAVFFDTDADLLAKVRYYLAHPDERRRIAAAGRERCLRSGYSAKERCGQILTRALAAVGR